jgi:hypothetical protein
VDGSPLQVFGQAKVDLNIRGKAFPADVLVVSPLTAEAILGLDFLQQQTVTIDLGGKELLIGPDREVHVPLFQPSLPISKPKVQLVEAITIPPSSEVLVMADADVVGGSMYLPN